jgi:ABC-type molybdenum transport system ATPase subunit/photorepair protein PhrA
MNFEKIENPPTKELFLLRGLPGSGKSTLAKSLDGEHFEADMFFMVRWMNIYSMVLN